MTKRLFGSRPLLFMAVTFSFGILIGAACVSSLGAKIALFCIFAICASVMLAVKFFRRFAYLAVCALIGFLAIIGAGDIYNANALPSGENLTLRGQVTSEITFSDEFYFKIDSISVNGKSYSGQANVYFYSDDIDFRPGDFVEMRATVYTNDFNPFDSLFSSVFVKGSYYGVFTYSCYKISDGELDFFTDTELKVKENFYTYTRPDTADIATALIFGDKSTMNENLYDDVKVSGLAHVLAISGLHISILAMFVSWILKKCKVKSVIRLAVVGVLLLIYLVFCGFASSAMRAFIMTMCLMGARAFGKKPDYLSALSLAAIIIMLINPVNLFAVGFQLSVLAVLGIMLLNKPIIKFFKRDNKFTQLVTTSLSTNVMTYPVVANVFGQFPVFFLISNLIVLPLMSFIYIGVIILTLFTLIIPLPQILIILDYLLIPFKATVMALSSMAVASIPAVGMGVFSIGYYLAIIIQSRYIFIRRDLKIKISLSVLAVFLFLAAAVNFGI